MALTKEDIQNAGWGVTDFKTPRIDGALTSANEIQLFKLFHKGYIFDCQFMEERQHIYILFTGPNYAKIALGTKDMTAAEFKALTLALRNGLTQRRPH